MLSSVPAAEVMTDADRAFWFEVYADTRMPEISSWGWTAEQLHSFLHMQFNMQQTHLNTRYSRLDRRRITLGDVAIGQMTVFCGEQGWRLVDLAVLSRYRNRGAGTFMLRELQQQAAVRRVPINLQVRLDNADAQRLYRRMGFTEVRTQELHMEMQWSAFQSSNGGVLENE